MRMSFRPHYFRGGAKGGFDLSASLLGIFCGMGIPDFGQGIDEIELTIHFRNKKLPSKSWLSGYQKYVAVLDTHPYWKFSKTKRILEYSYESKMITGEKFEKTHKINCQMISMLYDEILATFKNIRERMKIIEDFDVDGFIGWLESKKNELPQNKKALKEFRNRIAMYCDQLSKKTNMIDTVEWEEYHPKAKTLLPDYFYWDPCHDFSPHGNDIGAEALEHYMDMGKERDPNNNEEALYKKICRKVSLNMSPGCSMEGIHDRSECIIGLAFAQIKMDGQCSSWVCQRALEAIQWQKDYYEFKHPDWELLGEKLASLKVMKDKLLEMQSQLQTPPP